MHWIIPAFLAPALFAVTNVLDSYLTNRLFKHISTLLFFGVIIDLVFLPIIFVLGRPSLPSVHAVPSILLLGLLNIAYLYPYFKAYQSTDTSIVSSFFNLTKFFTPLLAFIFVGERLSLSQYIGFAVIILCSVGIARTKASWKLNASFWYMLASSLMVSAIAILYKYIFATDSWATGFFWPYLASLLWTLPIILMPKVKIEIMSTLKNWRVVMPPLVIMEIITFLAMLATTFGIAAAPVTIVTGIQSLMPIFVVLYALIFGNAFPKLFREHISKKTVRQKLIYYILMLAGVMITLYGT